MPKLALKPIIDKGATANKHPARKHVPQNVPGLWLRGKTYWFKIRAGAGPRGGGKVHSGSLGTSDLLLAVSRLNAQRVLLQKGYQGSIYK
jgi:hypothetical protein